MHILGLCNGSIHGNSEILLKAALKAAIAVDPSTTVSWIHVPSVVIPRNAKPIKVDEIVPSSNEKDNKPKPAEMDDREAAYNAIMEADALIIATPIYSHQPAGTLKALADSILGPFADVSEAFRTRERQKAGDDSAHDVEINPRDLKARVAGFIAVGGSHHDFPEQWTMALPSMHVVTYSLHARVVDQVVFPAFGHAGAVLTDNGQAVDRARKLGERVVSQIGKPYDEAQYLGAEETGSCPYCHLLKIEYRNGNHITCIVCGARGQLVVRANGDIRPTWEADSDISAWTLKALWKHRDDVATQLALERPKLPGVEAEWNRWKNTYIPLVDLPSAHGKLTKELEGSHI